MYFTKKRILLMNMLILIALVCTTVGAFAATYNWKCITACLGSPAADRMPGLAKEIEIATNGQLKIDVFIPGEHPYQLGDQLKAVSDGEVQMSFIIAGYVSGLEPSFMPVDLPLLIPAGRFDIYRSLFKKFSDGYYNDVFNEWGVHLVLYSLTPSQNYYFKNLWMEDKNSLKGKKVRSWSKEVSNLITLMGGIPVTLAYEDILSGLQTGLIDGTTTNFFSAYDTNVFEICKNVQMIQDSYSEEMVVVNNKAWAELPSDIQKIVADIFEEEQKTFELLCFYPVANAFEGAISRFGVEIRPLPADFRQELVEGAYEAIWKPWLKNAGEKGEKAFELVVKEIENMGYKVPIPKE